MKCDNSYSASYEHFAFLVNQVEYLLVSNCSHTTTRYFSIILFTGNQSIDNTNSSMNNAIRVSGVGNNNSSSYCTFSNNKVFNSKCTYFSTSGTISVSYNQFFPSPKSIDRFICPADKCRFAPFPFRLYDYFLIKLT